MEYLLLGLLMLSPMTGYELQQFIKKNLSLICSHSAGSVQTALAKLEREQKIVGIETYSGKRPKKTYSITDHGRQVFSKWVAQPMQASKAKKMELAHLFFAGFATPDEQRAAIQNYIHQIEETHGTLVALKKQFETIRTNHESTDLNWQQVLRFQGYTIDYGIAAAEFECHWYRHLLDELEPV